METRGVKNLASKFSTFYTQFPTFLSTAAAWLSALWLKDFLKAGALLIHRVWKTAVWMKKFPR